MILCLFCSKNSMSCVAGLKFTTPHGLQYYEKYKKTPLSAHNVSNTSAHSGSHAFAVGSSSKGRFLVSNCTSYYIIFLKVWYPCYASRTHNKGRNIAHQHTTVLYQLYMAATFLGHKAAIIRLYISEV